MRTRDEKMFRKGLASLCGTTIEDMQGLGVGISLYFRLLVRDATTAGVVMVARLTSLVTAAIPDRDILLHDTGNCAHDVSELPRKPSHHRV